MCTETANILYGRAISRYTLQTEYTADFFSSRAVEAALHFPGQPFFGTDIPGEITGIATPSGRTAEVEGRFVFNHMRSSILTFKSMQLRRAYRLIAQVTLGKIRVDFVKCGNLIAVVVAMRNAVVIS